MLNQEAERHERWEAEMGDDRDMHISWPEWYGNIPTGCGPWCSVWRGAVQLITSPK